MSKAILFVYGSLKRGECNHALIADQKFLGPTATVPKYRAVDLGQYPGLVKDERNGLSIRGELFEVSDCSIAELDDFEGSPDHYKREPIEVVGFEGTVEAYFYQRSIPPGVRCGDSWPFGGN